MQAFINAIFGPPFVKWFALCYRSVCLVTLVYCGQTVGWVNMPLGTDIGLCPGHIVLDGTQLPLPTERGTAAPHFRSLRSLRPYKPRPMSSMAKRLDGTGCHFVRK